MERMKGFGAAAGKRKNGPVDLDEAAHDRILFLLRSRPLRKSGMIAGRGDREEGHAHMAKSW